MTAIDLDLVVVAPITLNPKKARRNLKKAAQKAALAAAAPATDSSVPASKPEPEPELSHEASPVAPSPAPAAATAPGHEEKASGAKRSWYDITEDDDDFFCGAVKPRAKAAGQGAAVKPQAKARTAAPLVATSAAARRAAAASQPKAPSKAVSKSRPAARAAPSPLSALPADAWAQVFLFTEVSAVGRCAATSTTLQARVWDDAAFWKAYGGPNLDVSAEAKRSPQALRTGFRRWVHGLEGIWGDEFAELAVSRHHADVFDDAAYLLAGLQPQDRATHSAQIGIFSGALVLELGRFDAECEKTRGRAFEAVLRAKSREALLPAGAADEMQLAFEASVERAHAGRHGALLSVAPAEKPTPVAAAAPAPALGRGAGASLALRALSFLGARHEGLGVEAAQRAVSGPGA